MLELLKRWAALEKERCVFDDEIGTYRVIIGFDTTGSKLSMRLYEPDSYALDRAAIQAAVQQATNARLWEWQIAGFFYHGELMFNAVVNTDCNSDGSGDPIKSAKGHNAAEALLSAYLTALEAQS